MAGESIFAMDIPNDFENNETNSPAEVDANFDEVETKFNAAMRTDTGHDHDGTNSKKIGTGNLTTGELSLAIWIGAWR